jgi:hypothetical protein
MSKRILVVFVSMIMLCFGAGGFHGVVRGGTIHQFQPAPYANGHIIYFSNGIMIDINEGTPELEDELTLEQSEYYVVHCQGPVYPEYVQQMESAGAKVYSYISNYAYIVRMTPMVKRSVELLGFVDWVGIYQAAYKVSHQPEFAREEGRQKVTIVLYPDASLDNLCDMLVALGAEVIECAESKWDKLINCEIDLALISTVAKAEVVNWIEPWHKMELHNDNTQWILQTASSGNRRIWTMGITGQGELVSTSDTGIRTSHYQFRNTNSTWITTWGDYPSHRKIIGYQPANSYGAGYADFGDESGNYYHGTHTGGTACGNDDVMGSPSSRDGIGIDSRIYFLDGGGSQGAVYLYPNLNTLFNIPYTGNSAGSVKLMSNSWGTSVNGAYTSSSAQVDQFMWDHKDFLLFFSNGNDGPSSGTVGSPATAKSCVSVGGCRNGASYQQIYSSSSRGPTQDNRYKPTILAPGQTLYSAYGGNDDGYWGMEGTSMSAPGAVGAGALCRQYFTDGWYPSGSATPSDSLSPSAALIKAVLVVSADPSVSGYTNVPNNNIGWGRIDLDSALYFAGDSKKLAIVDDQTGLSTGQYVEYTYTVTSSSEPFRVALVWTDYPGTAGSGIKLINDLHLTVTDPSSNQYKGNVYSSGQSTTGGVYDTLNVEECVRRNSPATGDWTVRVEAHNCPSGPQPFALVVTGAISTTTAPDVVYDSHTIDDSGGNNNGMLDPGETVYMTVTLQNNGSSDATNTDGTLRTASAYISLLDSTADYGTIPANGSTAQGTFQLSASASTPPGTMVAMTVHVEANGGSYTTNCNFNVQVGQVQGEDWVTHDVGNCRLTVTRYGTIGYMASDQFQGDGFFYPYSTGSHLFYGAFAVGNSANYCVDRYYEQGQSDDTDWETTATGMVVLSEPGPNGIDEHTTAQYDDSNHPSPQNLLCDQYGWAWDDATANDFVIMKFVLTNNSASTLSNIYGAVFMDWDIGTADQNQGGTNDSRNLTYLYYSTPYVGVATLDPPRDSATSDANLSVIDHDVYVYPYEGLPDSVQFKFMNGTYSAATTNRAYDWSTCNSAGPFTIAPGASRVVAFAILGGDNLSDLQVNADTAYQRYWNWPGVEEQGQEEVIATGIHIYPVISRGQPYYVSYAFNKETPVNVSVYDISGRLVTCKNWGMINGTGELQVDLKSAPQGIYFVQVKAGTILNTAKIIKLK